MCPGDTPSPSVIPISQVNVSTSILRISGPLEVEKLLWIWWEAGLRSTSGRRAGMASSACPVLLPDLHNQLLLVFSLQGVRSSAFTSTDPNVCNCFS